MNSLQARLEGWQDWQVAYGPAKGEKGEVLDVEVGCICVRFKPEKILCTVENMRVLSFSIGGREQDIVMSDYEGRDFKGKDRFKFIDGSKMDEVGPGEKTVFKVEFLEDSQFDAMLYGKAKVK